MAVIERAGFDAYRTFAAQLLLLARDFHHREAVDRLDGSGGHRGSKGRSAFFHTHRYQPDFRCATRYSCRQYGNRPKPPIGDLASTVFVHGGAVALIIAALFGIDYLYRHFA
jgi:hypothetical protein